MAMAASIATMVPHMATSPPSTPMLHHKRKFADFEERDLDLGGNSLDSGRSLLDLERDSPNLERNQLDLRGKSLDLGKSSLTRPAKAQRTFYGVDIHRLLDEAKAEDNVAKVVRELPTPPAEQNHSSHSSLLWTEKYRARKFTELIGDERTHRSVMHWLKRWDLIVFPGSSRSNPKQSKIKSGAPNEHSTADERAHRKILLLTGPPGLGKTTLAHVCARQAGYEVQEINASDERSGTVVKGRIRDMVGTENVRGVDTKTITGVHVRKAGKPVCVVVDEVDGVVSGSSGAGEGGFVKALIDLILLDQKNSNHALHPLQQGPAATTSTRKRKGDRFRLLRPLILICNDVYHPSLRQLRTSSLAEVVHVRPPQLGTIVTRLQSIFLRERIPHDADGVRRLCEAAWGVSARRQDRGSGGAGEGDMRGILVVAEWVAGRLRAESSTGGEEARLTRRWVEESVLRELGPDGGAARGLGRGGGAREVAERVFLEGAGFPTSVLSTSTPQPQQKQHDTAKVANAGVQGVAEAQKRASTWRLRELLDAHADTERVLADCFAAYPAQPFQDDTLLSKPAAAYEWLHFHDAMSRAVYTANEWELAPYLSTPVLGFHHLFASRSRPQQQHQYLSSDARNPNDNNARDDPFTGPQASYQAHEALKHNTSLLQTLHASLSPSLTRLFTSPADLATDFLPCVLRMLAPQVNPIVIAGSNNSASGSSKAGGGESTACVRRAAEQVLVRRSVAAMRASGVRFERARVVADADVDGEAGTRRVEEGAWRGAAASWVWRMVPAVDVWGDYGTLVADAVGGVAGGAKTRYAVRQLLQQACALEERKAEEERRKARFTKGDVIGADQEQEAGTGQSGEMNMLPASAATRKAVVSIAGKRDFFGRSITAVALVDQPQGEDAVPSRSGPGDGNAGRVWITFREGFSNAVRKPVTLADLMMDLL